MKNKFSRDQEFLAVTTSLNLDLHLYLLLNQQQNYITLKVLKMDSLAYSKKTVSVQKKTSLITTYSLQLYNHIRNRGYTQANSNYLETILPIFGAKESLCQCIAGMQNTTSVQLAHKTAGTLKHVHYTES